MSKEDKIIRREIIPTDAYPMLVTEYASGWVEIMGRVLKSDSSFSSYFDTVTLPVRLDMEKPFTVSVEKINSGNGGYSAHYQFSGSINRRGTAIQLWGTAFQTDATWSVIGWEACGYKWIQPEPEPKDPNEIIIYSQQDTVATQNIRQTVIYKSGYAEIFGSFVPASATQTVPLGVTIDSSRPYLAKAGRGSGGGFAGIKSSAALTSAGNGLEIGNTGAGSGTQVRYYSICGWLIPSDVPATDTEVEWIVDVATQTIDSPVAQAEYIEYNTGRASLRGWFNLTTGVPTSNSVVQTVPLPFSFGVQASPLGAIPAFANGTAVPATTSGALVLGLNMGGNQFEAWVNGVSSAGSNTTYYYTISGRKH